MTADIRYELGEPVRTYANTFSGADMVAEHFFRKPPNVQTCTRAPERKRFVYFQHRIAAQALLADMLGDVPPLIPVHNADQLRGLDAREPGTWVEVVGHPHMIPDNIWHAACDAGLLRLWLSDSNRREKFQRDMTGAVREAAKEFPPTLSPWKGTYSP